MGHGSEELKSFKTSALTIAAMALLAFSGLSMPALATKPNPGGVTHVFPAAPPTFVGSSSAFLSGPTLAPSQSGGGRAGPPSANLKMPNANFVDNLVAKPLAKGPPPTSTVPPTVSCEGAGCYAVSETSAAVTNPLGLSAQDSTLYTDTVEPPDQGLCVGNGYLVESVNQGEVQVYSAATLKNVSDVIPLDSIMGLTSINYSSGGDPMCVYDQSSGGHFFITEIVSASGEAEGGPFVGCFDAVPGSCYEGIAVSVTDNPMGAYYVYLLNPNKVSSDPGSDANPDYNCPFASTGLLFNDYAKTALTSSALLMSYDEFEFCYPNGDSYFYGAQQLAFDKFGLEQGAPSVNVAYEDMGTAPNLTPIPTNGIYQNESLAGNNWYSVIPAQSANPSQYGNSNGGTGFMIATLDPFGMGDNRTAVFDWTQLSALGSAGCNECSKIDFGGAIVTGTVTYQDEGGTCLASQYLNLSSSCGLAPQKAGTIPLGGNCYVLNTGVASCTEQGLASDGDFVTNAYYSAGVIWAAVNTIVDQKFAGGLSEYHVGATYWGIKTSSKPGPITFSLVREGYVTAAHEDIVFPAIAATGRNVLLSFTLSGDGGPTGADNGGFYPSSAYLMLSDRSATIHIAALGQAPQDGFTEYQGVPRWGDYGQAVFSPATGQFFFSSEYIPNPNCSPTAWLNDPTCGGTRVPYANWGTAISSIST